ncbi:MAG: hypothetical protein GXP15_08130 [Gammaproteobacteria bacterium]|nr:hypothetical protein [Gammaproteobacteria bacterium]
MENRIASITFVFSASVAALLTFATPSQAADSLTVIDAVRGQTLSLQLDGKEYAKLRSVTMIERVKPADRKTPQKQPPRKSGRAIAARLGPNRQSSRWLSIRLPKNLPLGDYLLTAKSAGKSARRLPVVIRVRASARGMRTRVLQSRRDLTSPKRSTYIPATTRISEVQTFQRLSVPSPRRNDMQTIGTVATISLIISPAYVTSFSPSTEGLAGGSLTINGVGLPTYGSLLLLGDSPLMTTEVTSTRITAVLPNRAMTGPLRLSYSGGENVIRLAEQFRVIETEAAVSKKFDAFVATSTAGDHYWNAHLLALLSQASYPGVVSPSPINEALLDSKLDEWGVEFVEWIDEETSIVSAGSGSTQAIIARTDDALFVAFRGSTITAEDLGQDWIDNDLDLTPRPMFQWKKGMILHDGFYDAAQISFDAVTTAIRNYRGQRKLWLTGHSLGGAVAFITAFHLEKDESIVVDGVHTFGAPPVGNNIWKLEYENRIQNTHRWNIAADPLPAILLLPLLPDSLQPFHHVGFANNLFPGSTDIDGPNLRYPLNTPPTTFIQNVTVDHMGYWCRMSSEANAEPPAPGC